MPTKTTLLSPNEKLASAMDQLHKWMVIETILSTTSLVAAAGAAVAVVWLNRSYLFVITAAVAAIIMLYFRQMIAKFREMIWILLKTQDISADLRADAKRTLELDLWEKVTKQSK